MLTNLPLVMSVPYELIPPWRPPGVVEAPYQMHARLAAIRPVVERHFSIQEGPVALAPECATKMVVNSILL